MRPVLYACLLFTFLAPACKKDGGPGNASLFGKWKMIDYTNGFTGQTIAIPADSSCYLLLTSDGTYGQQVKGTVEFGTYNIIVVNSIFNRQSRAIQLTSPATASGIPLLYEIHKDTLNLYMNVYDGNAYRYISAPGGLHPSNGRP